MIKGARHRCRSPAPAEKRTYQAYREAILFTAPVQGVAIIGHPVKIARRFGDRRRVGRTPPPRGRSDLATETGWWRWRGDSRRSDRDGQPGAGHRRPVGNAPPGRGPPRGRRLPSGRAAAMPPPCCRMIQEAEAAASAPRSFLRLCCCHVCNGAEVGYDRLRKVIDQRVTAISAMLCSHSCRASPARW